MNGMCLARFVELVRVDDVLVDSIMSVLLSSVEERRKESRCLKGGRCKSDEEEGKGVVQLTFDTPLSSSAQAGKKISSHGPIGRNQIG